MNKKKLAKLAAEIAQYVIDKGEVEEEEDLEWWLLGLGAAVAMEADARGLKNPLEIGDEAIRLYREKPSSSPPGA